MCVKNIPDMTARPPLHTDPAFNSSVSKFHWFLSGVCLTVRSHLQSSSGVPQDWQQAAAVSWCWPRSGRLGWRRGWGGGAWPETASPSLAQEWGRWTPSPTTCRRVEHRKVIKHSSHTEQETSNRNWMSDKVKTKWKFSLIIKLCHKLPKHKGFTITQITVMMFPPLKSF